MQHAPEACVLLYSALAAATHPCTGLPVPLSCCSPQNPGLTSLIAKPPTCRTSQKTHVGPGSLQTRLCPPPAPPNPMVPGAAPSVRPAPKQLPTAGASSLQVSASTSLAGWPASRPSTSLTSLLRQLSCWCDFCWASRIGHPLFARLTGATARLHPIHLQAGSVLLQCLSCFLSFPRFVCLWILPWAVAKSTHMHLGSGARACCLKAVACCVHFCTCATARCLRGSEGSDDP